MKRLAIALVLMMATEGYAQWTDPFGNSYLPDSSESGSDYWERKARERKEAFEQMEEDFARQQQNITNQQIQQYIREQRERQEDMDYQRQMRELGTTGR